MSPPLLSGLFPRTPEAPTWRQAAIGFPPATQPPSAQSPVILLSPRRGEPHAQCFTALHARDTNATQEAGVTFFLMGVCASCLGLNRHPSHDQVNESAALLDDSHHVHYGGLADEDVAPPDEDEIRRAREALHRITNEATENMIDVSHPSSTDLSQHLTSTNHDGHTAGDNTFGGSAKAVDAIEDDEAAWLRSVRSAGLDSGTQIKGLQSGSLVLDIGQLRSSSAPQHGYT